MLQGLTPEILWDSDRFAAQYLGAGELWNLHRI